MGNCRSASVAPSESCRGGVQRLDGGALARIVQTTIVPAHTDLVRRFAIAVALRGQDTMVYGERLLHAFVRK